MVEESLHILPYCWSAFSLIVKLYLYAEAKGVKWLQHDEYWVVKILPAVLSGEISRVAVECNFFRLKIICQNRFQMR